MAAAEGTHAASPAHRGLQEAHWGCSKQGGADWEKQSCCYHQKMLPPCSQCSAKKARSLKSHAGVTKHHSSPAAAPTLILLPASCLTCIPVGVYELRLPF